MLILSNCLTETADEGGLKLATSLVKRIKQTCRDAYVVSYERESLLSDVHLPINKLMLNRQLISLIRKRKQPVLYIPFPAPSLSMALRIWIVSLFAGRGLRVMLIRQFPMERIARILLALSRAEIVVFSAQARDFYASIVGNRVTYLKTGVDTTKFTPVTAEKAGRLKAKYGLDPERPVILHVGHMKEGRNIRQLMKLDKKYQILLVVSSLSKERQDPQLKEELSQCGNIRIIDSFVPNIEELYQLSDVYFFPVEQIGHCIDVPLSCMEAAACDKPVVTTDYGEMRELIHDPGFFVIRNFESGNLNLLMERALALPACDTRSAVLAYDWSQAVGILAGHKNDGGTE